MNEKLQIVGLVGSLRQESFNKAVMNTVLELSPDNLEIEVADIQFPLFNADLEKNMPAEVLAFKEKVKAADGILIVTPEYNYSVPGVLKNALDWASRPYGDNAFDGKPVAIMSASTGMIGGARAQHHLRQIFIELSMIAMPKPEFMVPMAQDKIKDGKIVDKDTKARVEPFLIAFGEWIKRLNN